MARRVQLRSRDDVKKRLQVIMDLWNEILDMWESGRRVTRSEVVELVREWYGRNGLVPIKGASNPPDLYDKELASLYVVGKHGMGLEGQYPDLFSEVFAREIKYEKAISLLLSEPPEVAREKVSLLLGNLDDNEIARMLRLKLTEVYFGLAGEDALINLLKALAHAFPEKERIVVKYARFYTALKVAKAIAMGEARDRLTKEALKQATALKIKEFHGVIPDDRYIEAIARELYGIPASILRDVLQLKRESRSRARGKEAR